MTLLECIVCDEVFGEIDNELHHQESNHRNPDVPDILLSAFPDSNHVKSDVYDADGEHRGEVFPRSSPVNGQDSDEENSLHQICKDHGRKAQEPPATTVQREQDYEVQNIY